MHLPVEWANYISMALFVILAVGVWTVPKHAFVPERYAGETWRDLRLWASALIAIQIAAYATFS